MTETVFPHLHCRQEQGVLVGVITAVQMQGDDLADDLRQELLAAVAEFGATKVVLDFQNVKYLGSAGFRPLLSLHRKLHETGGRMIFIHLSPEVEEVFLITRLISKTTDSISPFEMAPTLGAALVRLKEGDLPKKG